jgi:hypothetical protein
MCTWTKDENWRALCERERERESGESDCVEKRRKKKTKKKTKPLRECVNEEAVKGRKRMDRD